MTRLLYKLNISTGFYETVPIITGHTSIIAMYKDLTWKLISHDTGKIIVEKTAKNSHALKKDIKKSLIEYGAIFEDEIRPRN